VSRALGKFQRLRLASIDRGQCWRTPNGMAKSIIIMQSHTSGCKPQACGAQVANAVCRSPRSLHANGADPRPKNISTELQWVCPCQIFLLAGRNCRLPGQTACAAGLWRTSASRFCPISCSSAVFPHCGMAVARRLSA
jgi:hypothetical protein